MRKKIVIYTALCFFIYLLVPAPSYAQTTHCQPLGDINCDGSVGITDLSALLASFGATQNQPHYNPRADLNNDGSVTLTDLSLLVSNFGRRPITPSPLPTAPLSPSPTNPPATPTRPPTAQITPYPNAPECTSHDSRAYHGIWNSERGCHYDHTHGDNPHEVDDVFGRDVFSMMGGEISYPWHTPGENEEIKHKSYMWLVRKNVPCYSQFENGCLTDFRVFVHNDLHNVASTHHSALVEARVCEESNPTNCGYFLVSGHQATGDLLIDERIVLDRFEPQGAPRPTMLHYANGGNRNFATWYPAFSSWMRVSTEIGDMFGYYPLPDGPLPVEPSALTFIRLEGNASRVQPHVIGLGMSRRNLLSIGVSPTSPSITYSGFLNVHTAEPGDCTAIGPMCAPLILRNVPNRQYQYRGDYREYDVLFGRNSSGWIEFPGFVR